MKDLYDFDELTLKLYGYMRAAVMSKKFNIPERIIYQYISGYRLDEFIVKEVAKDAHIEPWQIEPSLCHLKNPVYKLRAVDKRLKEINYKDKEYDDLVSLKHYLEIEVENYNIKKTEEQAFFVAGLCSDSTEKYDIIEETDDKSVEKYNKIKASHVNDYKKRLELLREEVNDLKFKNSITVTIGPLTNKKM